MTVHDSFASVKARLEAGEASAADEIFRRFAHRMAALARTRLNPRMRSKEDAEDVVQSAMRSFFVRQRDGRFELTNWDGLWGLLVRITLRKCGRRVESLHAACRDLRREVSAAEAAESGPDLWQAVARDPDPQEVAALEEVHDDLMDGLNETQQQILCLKLAGLSPREISEALVDVSEHRVYRTLTEIRRRLEKTETQE